jgi:hypothetical protein
VVEAEEHVKDPSDGVKVRWSLTDEDLEG